MSWVRSSRVGWSLTERTVSEVVAGDRDLVIFDDPIVAVLAEVVVRGSFTSRCDEHNVHVDHDGIENP